MLYIGKEHVTDNLSPHNPPAARCRSGETAVFQTRDCYDDRLHADGTVEHPELALENPATGPLYVEEAAPGDVLKVKIEKIDVNPTGLMRASTSAGAFSISLPRYITAISSEKWFTTERSCVMKI